MPLQLRPTVIDRWHHCSRLTRIRPVGKPAASIALGITPDRGILRPARLDLDTNCAEPGVTEMNLSYVQKLLMAVDPFSSIRASFRSWRKKTPGDRLEDKKRKRLRRRHLTCRQREDISTDLEDSVTGPVSITASASDAEAVCYEDEIANVLAETGFEVEIDNAARKPAEEKIPTGLEMTVKDETIRPVHARRILHAFRHAGVAIATRINAMRRSNSTLYITVGSNAAPGAVPPLTARKKQKSVE